MRSHPARRGGRGRGAARTARRAWPYLVMAWERWQSLTPEERDRYKRRARGYAERGRAALRRRPPR